MEESYPGLTHGLIGVIFFTCFQDLLMKREKFISKFHVFRQEFGNVDPIVYMELVSIYLSIFYGSNLWDLYGQDTDKLYKTWNIMIKMTLGLPRETQKYLVETPSQNTTHNSELK